MKTFMFHATPGQHEFKEKTQFFLGAFLTRLIVNGFPTDGIHWLVFTEGLNTVHPRWPTFTPGGVPTEGIPFMVKDGICDLNAAYSSQFPLTGGPSSQHDYSRIKYMVLDSSGNEVTSTNFIMELIFM